MPTYSGTVKSFTRTASAFAFTLTNASPPPPEFLFAAPQPEWVRDTIIPLLGKTVEITTTAPPESITTIKATA